LSGSPDALVDFHTGLNNVVGMNAIPSADDALAEAMDAFTAERAQLDKAFEVLAAVNAAAGRVERYGAASEADDLQKLPRLGSESLQLRPDGMERCINHGLHAIDAPDLLIDLCTGDERTSLELIAANAAYYSAVRRKDADLMEQLLDDDCAMGNSHNFTRGKEQNARDFRNYCENQTPPKYPYLVELDDVQVFLDSENVGRVVVSAQIKFRGASRRDSARWRGGLARFGQHGCVVAEK
jgi:ketosteroid isomerase-like protein